MGGRSYYAQELRPHVGTVIKAFIDDSIGGADAICFTVDGEFIANSQNRLLWLQMSYKRDPRLLDEMVNYKSI
jgi:hypothetical protein